MLARLFLDLLCAIDHLLCALPLRLVSLGLAIAKPAPEPLVPALGLCLRLGRSSLVGLADLLLDLVGRVNDGRFRVIELTCRCIACVVDSLGSLCTCGGDLVLGICLTYTNITSASRTRSRTRVRTLVSSYLAWPSRTASCAVALPASRSSVAFCFTRSSSAFLCAWGSASRDVR